MQRGYGRRILTHQALSFRLGLEFMLAWSSQYCLGPATDAVALCSRCARTFVPVIIRHNRSYHLHADDVELNPSFDPSEVPSALNRLYNYLLDI